MGAREPISSLWGKTGRVRAGRPQVWAQAPKWHSRTGRCPRTWVTQAGRLRGDGHRWAKSHLRAWDGANRPQLQGKGLLADGAGVALPWPCLLSPETGSQRAGSKSGPGHLSARRARRRPLVSPTLTLLICRMGAGLDQEPSQNDTGPARARPHDGTAILVATAVFITPRPL